MEVCLLCLICGKEGKGWICGSFLQCFHCPALQLCFWPLWAGFRLQEREMQCPATPPSTWERAFLESEVEAEGLEQDSAKQRKEACMRARDGFLKPSIKRKRGRDGRYTRRELANYGQMTESNPSPLFVVKFYWNIAYLFTFSHSFYIIATGTIWPVKSKILPTWPLTKTWYKRKCWV